MGTSRSWRNMAERKNEGGDDKGKKNNAYLPLTRRPNRCLWSLSLSLRACFLGKRLTTIPKTREPKRRQVRSLSVEGARRKRARGGGEGGGARALSQTQNSKRLSTAQREGRRAGREKNDEETTTKVLRSFSPTQSRVVPSRTTRFLLLCFSFLLRLEEEESSPHSPAGA